MIRIVIDRRDEPNPVRRIYQLPATHGGYATLPESPTDPILAGILADMIEEHAYVGTNRYFGYPPMPESALDRMSLYTALTYLRENPLHRCTVTIH